MSNYLYTNRNIILVFLISLFLCLIGIGAYPIYILDEAKNAEAAREMLVNNDYIVPTFNNILRTDKPPLHYYFMILGYKIFGVNPFGARFFSAIFGTFTMVTSFYFIRKFSGKVVAKIFILIIWSSIFFIQEFHLAVPDPYLIFFISCALWLFYNFHKTENHKSLWFMYILFGLGVLTKGPVAILLPGLICLLFFIITKSLTIKNILKYRPFLGLLILILISLPWYLLVHKETHGAWTQGFFLEHNINRFATEKEGHGGLFLITWGFVLLGLMPFSFFSFYAFKNAYKNRKDSLLIFSSIASLVFIAFFSISNTKLPNYTMPCYPFLALVISKGIFQFFKSKNRNLHIDIVIITITLLSVALPIAGKFALMQENALKNVSNIAFWLIPTSIATIIGAFLYFKNQLKNAFLTIVGGWMLLTPILFLVIYPKITIHNPVEKVKSIIKNENHIAAYKRFDAAFPINFQQTFMVFQTEEEVTSYFDQFPEGFLITNNRDIEPLKTRDDLILIFEEKALFESHTTRVFKKRQ